MTDAEADRFERAAESLTTMVAGLREDMARAESIRDELQALTRTGKVTRFIVLVQAFIVAGMLAMGVVQYFNVKTLNQVVATQHDAALCPLYQIFLKSDTPANRDVAQRRGDDMAERAKAFDTIRHSYAALNCQSQ